MYLLTERHDVNFCTYSECEGNWGHYDWHTLYFETELDLGDYLRKPGPPGPKFTTMISYPEADGPKPKLQKLMEQVSPYFSPEKELNGAWVEDVLEFLPLGFIAELERWLMRNVPRHAAEYLVSYYRYVADLAEAPPPLDAPPMVRIGLEQIAEWAYGDN